MALLDEKFRYYLLKTVVYNFVINDAVTHPEMGVFYYDTDNELDKNETIQQELHKIHEDAKNAISYCVVITKASMRKRIASPFSKQYTYRLVVIKDKQMYIFKIELLNNNLYIKKEEENCIEFNKLIGDNSQCNGARYTLFKDKNIYECLCDERPKHKVEESTHLTWTGVHDKTN